MADSKKTAPVEEAKVVSPTERYKGWDMSRIFWGLLLVLAGFLLLLNNLDIVEVNFGNLWQLWPLLIVAWGVSLLNIKGTWWNVVSVILLIASLGIIAWAAIGTTPFSEVEDGVQTQQVEKTSATIERLDATIKAGAGRVIVGSKMSDVPIEAVLESSFATLDVDSRTDGSTQKVDVSVDGHRMWWSGGFRNDLNVLLTRDLPIFLKIETGASDLDADLSQVMLERLDIDLGATNSVVTLGDLVDSLDVNLSAGASSVTLRVPTDSGVSVKLDKGASSQNLDNLADKGDGIYETDGFDAASKKITIVGDIGVTSFTLERY